MCRGISVFVLSLPVVILLIIGETVEETQSQLFIEDIRQRTKEMIVERGKVVAKLLATFPDMGAQAIQTADVDDVRDKVIRVENLLLAAQETGKDISTCIRDETRRADKIQEIALKGLKKCYIHVQQAATDITKALQLLISEMQLDMAEVEEELLNCFLLSNSTVDMEIEASGCLATEVDRLAEKQLKELKRIEVEILKLQHLADDVLRQGIVCLTNEEQKALKLELALVKEIEECIKSLS